MARRPKNPINDIINTTSAWLGGNRGTMPSQTRKGIDTIKGVGKVLDSATGGFGQAVVSDAQRMAQSGSSTPSALYKTAAVNLAAAAAGVGAAKVAGKVASNVVESGVPARVVNKVTGQQVILHGSPVKNIRTLQPLTSSKMAPNVPVKTLYGMNPEIGQTENLGKFVDAYARQGGRGAKLKVDSPGSIYVATVPKSSIVNPASIGPNAKVAIVSARSTGKVVKEIPVSGLSEADLQQRVIQAVKRAGARVPKKK